MYCSTVATKPIFVCILGMSSTDEEFRPRQSLSTVGKGKVNSVGYQTQRQYSGANLQKQPVKESKIHSINSDVILPGQLIFDNDPQ